MAERVVHRHPIRGAIWGLLFGAGLGLLLMVLSIIPLSIPMLIVYAAAATVLGILWGLFAPPKKAPAPPTAPAMTDAPPAAAT